MAKGDGSITEVKRRDGKSFNPKHWRICLSFGKDPLTKERIKVQEVFEGTKTEARKRRDQIKAEHDSGLSTKGAKMTFSEFANQWHDTRVTAGEVGRTRLAREKCIIDEICSHMGDVLLREISPQTIDALYTRIRKEKTEKRGKCSGTTMNMVHKLLKQILQTAVDYDLILRNPAAKVRAPKCETPDRRSLTAQEARKLLAAINGCGREGIRRAGDEAAPHEQ